jgi:cellobiose phosphorylase
MYRLIVESLLGLRLAGETLHIEPCLPADWPGCKIHYRYRETVYHIAVGQTRSDRDMEGKSGERGQKSAEKSRVTNVRLDGIEQHSKAIPLLDDRQEHFVEVQVQTT